MDGPEAYGIGQEAARAVAGSAVGAGGYLYFTKTRGVRMIVGALTSFGGGVIGYHAVVSSTGLDAGLSAGIACTATLGIIFSVRKAAVKLDAAQWLGEKK